MKRRALLSVYDKNGIIELGQFLVKEGWELVSTGGTSKAFKEAGLPVTDVSSITGFPECLDGRVKTLHPAIHAGLLARRDKAEHLATLESQGLGTIDLVCVNLYPFFEKVQAGLSLEETVEFIDIGGPTMLRSAAKNFQDVLVLTDPADYPAVMQGLEGGKGPEALDLGFKKQLAGKVFDLTSAYDGAIARYLLDIGTDSQWPQFWPMTLKKAQELRYGENSHQKAALYLNTDRPGAFGAMQQIHGKELSYNNIRDLDLAWKAASAFNSEEFKGLVSCVAVKHNSPCGIALAKTLPEAYARAYECDPVSIFGGIIATNSTVDALTAAKLAELFLEIVVAPAFAPDALDILKKKKNIRIMLSPAAPRDTHECIAVDGGLLVQTPDRSLMSKWEVVTEVQPPEELKLDMLFGMHAVTFAKSNAIAVIKDMTALGIGGGQTNRIWAAQQALERAKRATGEAEPCRVMASDAFFPFSDCVEAAAAAGIKVIIQPGGSIHDKDSIEACNKHGIAMVFTGTRHFKH
jgi:phosphoribosylaminoimidazolecarboxamide formyltransferase/IMP cyclohydrolase